MNKPRITDEVIRMIRADELTYVYPKEPFMTTPNSEVYRGEFLGFQVAIKRYTDPVSTSPRLVSTKPLKGFSVFTSEPSVAPSMSTAPVLCENLFLCHVFPLSNFQLMLENNQVLKHCRSVQALAILLMLTAINNGWN